MAKGIVLCQGDKTKCGGKITAGSAHGFSFGKPQAREGDPVTCGKNGKTYQIIGGISFYTSGPDKKRVAGSLDSHSSCPCKAKILPSNLYPTYTQEESPTFRRTGSALATSSPAVRPQKTTFEQQVQAVKRTIKPEPLPLPAVIYQTKKQMDDYQADDMQHGDLDIHTLRNRFRIDVNEVSTKVNPHTLKLKVPVGPHVFKSPYSLPGLGLQEMPSISKEQCAALMFDEFRELAKLFSFHGEYKNVIIEMITHMQGNTGKPFRSPLLDKALKEQIENDLSDKSSLLSIKKTLKNAIDFNYGFILLSEVDFFKSDIQNNTILPKFDRLIDRTNGLVITIHDTWSTHITLESLEVQGDIYKARIHYRVQDHFGLDNIDVTNPIYNKFRLFRLWFTLQRWDEYDYKPFITEMNATVEIRGRRGE